MSPDDASSTRRTVLKTVGATAVGLTVTAGAAAADHEHPDVTTVGATDVTQHSATLLGEVESFGEGAGAVEAWFEWDIYTATGFSNSTERVGLLAPGSYSYSLRGLSADTHYKFRAVAEDNDDGDRDYGNSLRLTTEAEDGDPVK